MKFHNALQALNKQQEVEAFFMNGDCTLAWALNRCSEDLNQKRLAVVPFTSQISAAETKVDSENESADKQMRAINREEKEAMDQKNAQIAKIEKEYEKKREDIQQRKMTVELRQWPKTTFQLWIELPNY